MQLLGRLLSKKNKKSQIIDDDTIASSTSTVNEKKKFSLSRLCSIRFKNNKKQRLDEKDPKLESIVATENQVLLTQCIETALFIPSPPSIMNNNRLSLPVEKKSINFVDSQPHQQQRQRKLSLPPQYSNIGYLASIPEVDSYSE